MTEKKVTLYSTPTCPFCKRAKAYLSDKGVSFTDYNVAQDKDKAKEMIRLSGQMSVPVIIIGDEIIVGFNQTLVDKALSG
jgi:glutaredoxin 3